MRWTVMVVLLLGLLVGTGCGGKETPAAGHKTVGIVYFGPDEACDNCIGGVVAGLAAEGFVEGQNLTLVKKHAGGEIANIAPIMQSLETQGVDAIVPMTTPCVAAAANTVRHTPVVFCFTYDPLGAGAGRSFTDHLPNFTGVASFPPVAETMRFMRLLVPQATKFGTIYNPAEPNSVKAIGAAQQALAGSGVTLEAVTANNTNEVMGAAQALVARGVQGIWITGDNTAIQAIDAIVKTARDARLPLVLNDPEYVPRGAIAALGIGWHAVGEAGGKMLARVLRGENPATMPIVELAGKAGAINDTAAQAIGLTIPAEARALAQ